MRRSKRHYLVVLVLPVLGGACRSDLGDATIDATVDAASDLALVDLGAPPTAGPRSQVYVYTDSHNQQYDHQTVAFTDSKAEFAPPFSLDRALDCPSTWLGACTAYHCPPSQQGEPPPMDMSGIVDAGSPPPTQYPTAGKVSITGAASPFTFSPASNGYYYGYHDDSLAWQGGEDVSVAATGGDVPAFTATLTAPHPITVSLSAPLSIDRSRDFTMTWSGGGAGVVYLTLEGPDGPTGYDYLDCAYVAASGTATIPASALSHVQSATAELSVGQRATTPVAVSGWNTTFFLEVIPHAPNGDMFSGVHVGLK